MNKFLVLMFVVFLGLVGFTSAVNVGISPASMEFNNVLRGGYTEDDFYITINSVDEVNVHVEPFGEIANWINFSEENFTVSKNNPHHLFVYIQPSADVPNGNYSGYVRVTTDTFAEGEEGHLTGKVLASVDLKIDVAITDKELLRCSVLGAGMNAVEEGYSSDLKIDLRNSGNIWINPDVFVKIWDRDQTQVIYSNNYKFPRILPTNEGKEMFEIDSTDLPVGQYFVELSVPDCLSSRLLTFDVLEEGALRAEGVFTSLLARPEGKVGEIIPLEANFRNTGEKVVRAKFSGEILFDNKIVDTLESDLIEVPMGSVEKFSLRFTPEKAGKYIVQGRFIYDSKKTFEKKVEIDVFGGGPGTWIYFLYAFFIAGIIFLLYKLNHERHKYRRRLRK